MCPSAYAAPILAQINADLGPDDRYVWIALVYTVCSAVWFPIIGRLGDIFGRRYLMILGNVLAIIGSIICATASNVLVMIGGNVFLGSASAFQLSFSYVLQELLPMKYRYLGSGAIYPWSIPGSGFGPAIAYAFVTHYSVGWRGLYWFLLAINGCGLICWVLFYFPPTFEQKHKQDYDSKMYWVKNFDYVGTFLFAAGFVVFLLGMSVDSTLRGVTDFDRPILGRVSLSLEVRSSHICHHRWLLRDHRLRAMGDLRSYQAASHAVSRLLFQ